MAVLERMANSQRTQTNSAQQKLAITVLAGGLGGEREVSLESGRAVKTALESLGHEVFLADIDPTNLSALARNTDCVFVALHGLFGEDGQVQAILEKRGIAYSGSGPEACALAMDKQAAKLRMAKAGLPTPPSQVIYHHTIDQAVKSFHKPVFVKPRKEGSSLHCFKVEEVSILKDAVSRVLEKYEDCLVEEFIPGKELTVAILGDRALPPIEIRTRRQFYDYAAKYVDDDTAYVFEIDLPPSMLKSIMDMSLQAHNVLGCRDFSRVDWRVDADAGKPYILEVNVIPGLTSHSLLPKAAAQAGISFPQACQHIINLALERRNSR